MGFLTTISRWLFLPSPIVSFIHIRMSLSLFFFTDFIAIIFAIKSHVPFQSASDLNVFYTYFLVFKPLFLETPDFYAYLKFQDETCDIL